MAKQIWKGKQIKNCETCCKIKNGDEFRKGDKNQEFDFLAEKKQAWQTNAETQDDST